MEKERREGEGKGEGECKDTCITRVSKLTNTAIFGESNPASLLLQSLP